MVIIAIALGRPDHPRPTPPAPEASRREAANAVHRQIGELRSAKDLSGGSFAAALATLNSAIAKASDAGVIVPKQAGCRQAMEAVVKANAQVSKCEKDGTIQPDQEPEKPTLGDYVTAKYICGTFRGRYTSDGGGIVIIYRDEYYVIKGADVPVFNRVCGYVDEDGPDIDLDTGHSAKQMTLLDSVEYKEAVKDGRANYAAALNTYKVEIAKWRDVTVRSHTSVTTEGGAGRCSGRWETPPGRPRMTRRRTLASRVC